MSAASKYGYACKIFSSVTPVATNPTIRSDSHAHPANAGLPAHDARVQRNAFRIVHAVIVPHSQPLLFTDSRFSGILTVL